MSEKEIIGGLAVAIGMVSYVVYMWGIYRRTIKPHVFTWLIWGLLMSIGFAAQHVEKAGPGSWVLAMSAVINFIFAGSGYFCGDRHISKSDWLAFLVALLAIPVWVMTDNPLWAVIIVSAIDAVALYPTFRKSWLMPQEEGALSFFIGSLQFMLSIFALEKINVTTVLYPAVIVILNMSLVAMLLYRRRAIAE